jgi:hypothetical protein
MKHAAGLVIALVLVVPVAGSLESTPADATRPRGAGSDAQSVSTQASAVERAFVEAAQRGDENAVRKALEGDPGLARATDAMGMTALDWAATREHWHIFRMLIAAGAPVDRVGFDGGTVSHRVAHFDRPDIMRLLLDAGADLTVANQWGRTPLHVASRRGARQVAELLLARGADPNVGTAEGWTSLHVAYRSGQPDLVELLLANGADPTRADAEGKVPAEHAFERPRAVSIDLAALFEYQGLYDVSDDFHFKVWVEDGKLRLRDFAADELYPTGPDAFYCRSEPWSVSFRRDASGEIVGIDVRFLRRTASGAKRKHPQYVGSQVCAECHLGQQHGNEYVPWLSSRHAAAYWRLATDWALFLAHQRPHYQDVTDPIQDDRCLLCHTTGAQDPDALFAASFDPKEGVGCEACHGPGSMYVEAEVMADRSVFLEAGGRIPGAETCAGCHRNPDQFDFEQWWPRIAHGGS